MATETGSDENEQASFQKRVEYLEAVDEGWRNVLADVDSLLKTFGSLSAQAASGSLKSLLDKGRRRQAVRRNHLDNAFENNLGVLQQQQQQQLNSLDNAAAGNIINNNNRSSISSSSGTSSDGTGLQSNVNFNTSSSFGSYSGGVEETTPVNAGLLLNDVDWPMIVKAAWQSMIDDSDNNSSNKDLKQQKRIIHPTLGYSGHNERASHDENDGNEEENVYPTFDSLGDSSQGGAGSLLRTLDWDTSSEKSSSSSLLGKGWRKESGVQVWPNDSLLVSDRQAQLSKSLPSASGCSLLNGSTGTGSGMAGESLLLSSLHARLMSAQAEPTPAQTGDWLARRHSLLPRESTNCNSSSPAANKVFCCQQSLGGASSSSVDSRCFLFDEEVSPVDEPCPCLPSSSVTDDPDGDWDYDSLFRTKTSQNGFRPDRQASSPPALELSSSEPAKMAKKWRQQQQQQQQQQVPGFNNHNPNPQYQASQLPRRLCHHNNTNSNHTSKPPYCLAAAMIIKNGNINRTGEFGLDTDKARYLVIKSFTEESIFSSLKYSVWCSTFRGNQRLDKIFRATAPAPVYLFFSVNNTGNFCGVAEMTSTVDFEQFAGCWSTPRWKGAFSVRWLYVKDVPFRDLRDIVLADDARPVCKSRDTQEVLPSCQGVRMLRIFHERRGFSSLFDDFEWYEDRLCYQHQPQQQQQPGLVHRHVGRLRRQSLHAVLAASNSNSNQPHYYHQQNSRRFSQQQQPERLQTQQQPTGTGGASSLPNSGWGLLSTAGDCFYFRDDDFIDNN